jgi:hypothetical protein
MERGDSGGESRGDRGVKERVTSQIILLERKRIENNN